MEVIGKISWRKQPLKKTRRGRFVNAHNSTYSWMNRKTQCTLKFKMKLYLSSHPHIESTSRLLQQSLATAPYLDEGKSLKSPASEVTQGHFHWLPSLTQASPDSARRGCTRQHECQVVRPLGNHLWRLINILSCLFPSLCSHRKHVHSPLCIPLRALPLILFLSPCSTMSDFGW